MFEIIIFAIIAFFVLKKLGSILGEEDDKLFFGYDDKSSCSREIKDAEQVDISKDAEEEEVANLAASAKSSVRELKSKLDGFTLNKFLSIATKVLEMVIKANNDGNEDTIKGLLSPQLATIVCSSFKEDSKNNIILVECVESKIDNVFNEGKDYRITVIFSTKQINYTTDKDGNVVDGDKSEILNVREKWTFVHNIATKNKTWFVDKIEEC